MLRSWLYFESRMIPKWKNVSFDNVKSEAVGKRIWGLDLTLA
jgi:hypothetical protein